MTFNDNTCPVCEAPITVEDETVFRSDGTLVHAYPCGEVRVFVYGTLREGGPLAGWLPRTAFRETARVKGWALHYAPEHRAYPYLVADGDECAAIGELVTIPTEDVAGVAMVERLTRMETGAGYTATMVRVETKEGVFYDALAYVWKHETSGVQVPDNDWTHAPQWEAFGFGVSPVVHDERDDEDGPVLYLHSGGKPFIRVTDATGEHVAWEGSSYTQLTKWTQENNVTLIRATKEGK